jgi:hypothetical protein
MDSGNKLPATAHRPESIPLVPARQGAGSTGPGLVTRPHPERAALARPLLPSTHVSGVATGYPPLKEEKAAPSKPETMGPFWGRQPAATHGQPPYPADSHAAAYSCIGRDRAAVPYMACKGQGFIGLAVPGRPIGPWSRRTEAPERPRPDGTGPRSVLGPWRTGTTGAQAVTSGHQRRRDAAGRRAFGSCSSDNARWRIRLWSRRSGLARRAADGQQSTDVRTNTTVGE